MRLNLHISDFFCNFARKIENTTNENEINHTVFAANITAYGTDKMLSGPLELFG